MQPHSRTGWQDFKRDARWLIASYLLYWSFSLIGHEMSNPALVAMTALGTELKKGPRDDA